MENEKNLEELQEENLPAEEAIAAQTVTGEHIAAETLIGEAASAAEEETHAEETAQPEESKPEEKKATPGKIALMVVAIVLVIALIVGLLAGGMGAAQPAETAPVETTEPAPTVPADGNPDDETCKGTYTVTDEEVIANADTVVATIGDYTLTNSQLQAFYWMRVQNFLNSEYGSYMMYYGMLDYTQPLDTQVCAMAETGTWQQFFLKDALATWQKYCALADKANEAGLELSEEEMELLNGLEESLTETAQYYGLASVEELLKYNMGAGADLEDYSYFQELMIRGDKYYSAEYEKLIPTDEEMEAYFVENETALAENGITREGKLVDVRHILFTPEGGTTDETGVTTYSEEEWEACRAKAEDILTMWTAGAQTEESFAALATAMTQDPGSKETGGLYEDVQQGQMVEEFDAWCFDETREPGHHGIVKTTYGYHVMYFVDSTAIWQEYVSQNLLAEKSSAMMQELTAQYPMEVDYSAISLGYVDMAA